MVSTLKKILRPSHTVVLLVAVFTPLDKQLRESAPLRLCEPRRGLLTSLNENIGVPRSYSEVEKAMCT